MDLVTINNGIPSTTSLAVAEGTDTQHKNVLDLVRTYQVDLEEFGGVAFKTLPFETAGGVQQREVAMLNEPQTTLLMTYMRNSDIVRFFKKRLVKAFFELAQQAALARFNVPTTYPEAMRLAADLSEQKAVVEAQLAIAAPKVEAFDRISTADGMVNLQTAGKILQQPPNKFIQSLREKGWIFKRSGSRHNSAHVEKINAGYLAVKLTSLNMPDGTEQRHEQVMVTPKGIAKLAMILGGAQA